MSGRRFCECEHPLVLTDEDGVRSCSYCGKELEPAPPGAAAADLFADRVAAKLARQLGRPEPWVGVAEAAAHLHCKAHRIYDLCSRGDLPHAKEGTRLLFRRSQLDAWLDRRNAA